ncbi:copper resistance CopC/CopD family protein [Micromonospora aurantiaca (nom. illeg.)]|uniref:copper resistance CopC/CopD family protein n=1 Tax=Micromonospora aurantiaca (nom. illeg.) TaxID=47850 RepID=UPI00165743CA|nr:CopD family protein [Micromonospora aurantiaca]MBC9005931.1 copper resistance protein CopC/CopD [Micromonospora aurantiaca]
MRGVARWVLLVWLAWCPALFVVLGFASPAAAHFKLVKAVPADGARVSGAVGEVRLTFSAPGTPTGAGFRLSRDGEAVAVTSHTPDGGRTWLVHPAAPLTGGEFALRWSVAAPDAHPLTGDVAFTVVPSAAAPGATATPRPTAGPPGHAGHGVPGLPSASPSAHAGGHAVGHTADAEQGAVRFVGVAGRWLSYGAILLGVGGLVFALTTLVGTRRDIQLVQVWVRAAGLTVAAGAVLELAALAAVFSADGGLASAAGTQALTALSRTPVAAGLGLRLAGAAGLLVAGSLEPALIRGRHAVGRHAAATVAGIPTDPQPLVVPTVGEAHDDDAHRVRAHAVRPVLLGVTVALLVGSFLLDGHTVTARPRMIVVAADVAHTLAAAVWVGGVLLLAALLLGRARLGAPTGAAEMAVRFSVPATAAVTLTGVAGVALTVAILDRPGHLVSTSWGRVLLVKVALVAVVAVIGLYNSRRVVPRLDDPVPGGTRRLRRTVLVEAVLMVAVLLVTAILVNAGT